MSLFRKTQSPLRKFLGMSWAVHGVFLVILWGLFHWGVTNWGGGRDGGGVELDVIWIESGTKPVSGGEEPSWKESSDAELHLKEKSKKIQEQTGTEEKSEPSPISTGPETAVKGASDTLGPNEGSGNGDSPTPNGGAGSGMDAESTQRNPTVLDRIRQRILRVREYPEEAEERDLGGVVVLKFKIKQDGSLDYVKVAQSSGYGLLDDAGVSTVKRATPLPFYEGEITMPLKFDLKDRF